MLERLAIMRSETIMMFAVGIAIASALAFAWIGTSMSAANAAGPDIRAVVFHKPGLAWKAGVPFREQPGVQAHVDHYRKLLEQGKLALGGPFLDDGGGMMIAQPGVTLDEARDFAAADPAVKSGLLAFEVKPWMVAMKAK